jgi:hypothetical protein
MDKHLSQKKLTTMYTVMNIIFFTTIFISEIYVICFQLCFKFDRAGYIILLTQLAVISMRLFIDEYDNQDIEDTWFHSTIFIGG